MALDILIVDDEADIRELVAGILSDEGYGTRVAHDCDSALAELEARRPSLLILDIWLQGSRLDGLEVLELVKRRHPDLPVVIISGHGNVETAVAAIKRGAYDFIEKPFKADQLLFIVARATEAEELRRENEDLKRRVGPVFELTGNSGAINAVRQAIERVAPTNSRVLFSGPPGSGKEVAARLLHARSKRFKAPFVIVSAASMEPHRMEEELFGIERDGGLVKTGLFERAHAGTLFIDEVADMPMTTQGKILRILTEQTFERVGGSKRVQVDVRVVSASSRDLRKAITQGTFREDLFHRLSVVPIQVPSLCERRDDIPSLSEHFVKAVAAATGRAPKGFSEPALAALQAYEWPGNVRQLRNVIERILIMAHDGRDIIEPDMLPLELTEDASSLLRGDSDNALMTLSLREAREAFEREYLRVQITRFSGNISKTANFIGMERSALHRKLKNLGLGGHERRDDDE
ncbi:sigma-54-dependent Fis family transcriptional regulator [Iodidimonas nitroreducens]|uniref:Sigma-54-dependent Fis family transcriptional regulator n=1 Tax=Iodidimonas nitroreducens TaxID=1236968 RepID=A0A5A7N443_9PROT|nr:sigma-54 dependent transcriptional regulator [Iodidimonas nitroreducens]GAK32883.1 nitrogen assimilation regulatory protein NtrX [alpha proteobacterium Q-1]GER03043.1 sigma-54-dependent Fis family transcriptional regulator [Iodidimonas nitroreducens]